MIGENVVRLFGLNNILIDAEIKRVEDELGVNLSPQHLAASDDKEGPYYPQFPARLREEARSMAIHYEIFYCLENHMRQLIADRLLEGGADWWTRCVPQAVRDTARKNMDREAQQGVTPRSEDPIDYINFGELGQIISVNWPTFGDMLKNKLAVERILAQLNLLRGPIAHCTPLAEDEVDRLQLSLRDWFRQMG